MPDVKITVVVKLKPGCMVSCCTDGLRPVVFKLVRIEFFFAIYTVTVYIKGVKGR